MSVDSRHIEQLSLRAERAADVKQAARTMSEALRLASLPGDGRPGWLFIRRLEMPPLRLGRSAHVVAAALGDRIRELRRSALEFGDPRAPKANAVIARDPLEPLTLALVRAGKGQRLTEWYWPQVHPRLQSNLAPAQIAAETWRLLAERSDAVVAVPAALAAVLDTDPGVAVFAGIDAGLGRALAARLRASPSAAAHWPAVFRSRVPVRWHRALHAALADFGPDLRAAWLLTAAVRAAEPWNWAADVVEAAHEPTPTRSLEPAAPVSDERLPTRTQQAQAEASLPPDRSAPSDAGPEPPERASPRPSAIPTAAGLAEAPATAPPAPPEAVPAARSQEDRPSAPAELATRPARPLATRWTPTERPRPTAHGGLLFLLHPLRRLGLGAFLEAHPELWRCGLGLHILARIADDLGVPPEDPMRLPLQAPPIADDLSVPWPPIWSDEVGGGAALAHAAVRPPLAADALGAWIATWQAAVSAFVLRTTELELASVVEREAALTCSRTHVDVIFAMNASDLRIRKAALDIDPGFVPWFGRVVRFHYVFGGLLDA